MRRSLLSVWSTAAVTMVAVAAATAQSPPSGRFFGPLEPARIDIDGDGPDAGDPAAYPSQTTPGLIDFVNPWQACSPSPSAAGVSLSNTGTAITDPAIYDRGMIVHGLRMSTIEVGNTNGGRPTGFTFSQEDLATFNTKTGSAVLVDTDANSRFDAVQAIETSATSSFPATQVDLVAVDTNQDGEPDYFSFPWSLGNAANFRITSCSAAGVGPGTQIWVPVAFDEAGEPTVILDTNGDGTPDPEFAFGPPLEATLITPAAEAIPTLGEWGALLFAGLLLAVGARQLRRPVATAGP
jgi:hypothetical protein